MPEADVVCRELGFRRGAHEIRTNFQTNTESNPNRGGGLSSYYRMDEIQCNGNESSLRDCNFILHSQRKPYDQNIDYCPSESIVGVVCKTHQLKCPDNYWLCPISQDCIPTAFVCDMTTDCEDGSDESHEICNVS